MIPAPFSYVRAESLDGAIALLGEHADEAKLLAGGHSLLPMMKLRLAFPAVLIDITRLDELRTIRIDGDELVVGAGVRHCELESDEVVRREAPLLSYVASHIGDRQIRHRGTIGGSLAHADPAADLPTAVLAAGATLVAIGPGGRRTIAVDDFFQGFFETALHPDEVLVEVRLPRQPAAGWAYEKFVRRANDWAIVAVAVQGDRIALANMGAVPHRAAATEAARAAGASIEDASALAADGTQPTSDMHADADYRMHLARVLTRRALTAAQDRQQLEP